MVDAIIGAYRLKVLRQNIVETTQVDASLFRIAATLVMRVDPAYPAEIVLRCVGPKVVTL